MIENRHCSRNKIAQLHASPPREGKQARGQPRLLETLLGITITPALFGTVPADQTWRMQQFSEAYIAATAAAAGCSASKPPVDDDSIDLILKRKTIGTIRRSPQLDIQVKATGSDCVRGNEIVFPLPKKNYDDLRDPSLAVPRILVVVRMPPNIEDWIGHTETELSLLRCGYWISLNGLPDTSNTTSVTIRISRTAVFNVTQLDNLFTRLASGLNP